MAKRKLRAWTKQDIAELKGSFKIQNAGREDFESDEKNAWGVKTESWDCRDKTGPSSLGTGTVSDFRETVAWRSFYLHSSKPRLPAQGIDRQVTVQFDRESYHVAQ